MNPDAVVALFRETGALLEGHFVYTSGRHGAQFLQAARVLQYPNHTERLCKALAQHVRRGTVDLVVGPATGGIILAYETARHLNARAAFSEKIDDGSMSVRRGIRVEPGARVFVVEDIVTTGGSVQKTVEHLRSRDAEVIGVGVLIDRSGGAVHLDCPFYALANLVLDSWPPDQCPLCADDVPLVEPDSLTA